MSAWNSLGILSQVRSTQDRAIEKCRFSNVIPSAVKLSRRPATEIVVCIENEGVTMFNLSSKKCTASSPRPPGTIFTCTPCSYKTSTGANIVISAQAKSDSSRKLIQNELNIWDDSTPESLAQDLKFTNTGLTRPVRFLRGVGEESNRSVLAVSGDGSIFWFRTKNALDDVHHVEAFPIVNALGEPESDSVITLENVSTQKEISSISLHQTHRVEDKTVMRTLNIGAAHNVAPRVKSSSIITTPVKDDITKESFVVMGSNLFFSRGNELRKILLGKEASLVGSISCRTFESRISKIVPNQNDSLILILRDEAVLFNVTAFSAHTLDRSSESLQYLSAVEDVRLPKESIILLALQDQILISRQMPLDIRQESSALVGQSRGETEKNEQLAGYSVPFAVSIDSSTQPNIPQKPPSIQDGLARLADAEQCDDCGSFEQIFWDMLASVMNVTVSPKDLMGDGNRIRVEWAQYQKGNPPASNQLVYHVFPNVSKHLQNFLRKRIAEPKSDFPTSTFHFLCTIGQVLLNGGSQQDMSGADLQGSEDIVMDYIETAKDTTCLNIASLMSNILAQPRKSDGILWKCVFRLSDFVDEEIIDSMQKYLGPSALRKLISILLVELVSDEDSSSEVDALSELDRDSRIAIILNCCLDSIGLSDTKTQQDILQRVEGLLADKISELHGCADTGYLLQELVRRQPVTSKSTKTPKVQEKPGGKASELSTMTVDQSHHKSTRQELFDRNKLIGSYVAERLEI